MVAEIQGGIKKKILRPQYFYNIFFPSYFGNVIATFHFFKKKKKKMICAHNFHNIFTTNFKWQVVIVGLKK